MQCDEDDGHGFEAGCDCGVEIVSLIVRRIPECPHGESYTLTLQESVFIN